MISDSTARACQQAITGATTAIQAATRAMRPIRSYLAVMIDLEATEKALQAALREIQEARTCHARDNRDQGEP